MSMCRQCSRQRPAGYTVTCGRSACQEAETVANRERAKLRRKPRARRLAADEA
jgi:hypothetical protein